jgi:ankyrin repeat protein
MFDLLIKLRENNLELFAKKNLEGLTPLSIAIGNGTPHMASVIVSRINRSSFKNELPICIDMLGKRSNKLSKEILEQFLPVYYHPQDSTNILHIICHYDNPDLLKQILDYTQTHFNNANELLEKTDEHGYTPLLTAAYYGHKSMVEILLERKAKYLDILTYEKKNILHLIAQRQHKEILIKLNEKLNQNDFITLMSAHTSQATPLHEISKTNNVELARLMLQIYKGDKIKLFEHQDSHGRTIFHEACEYGRLEMIEYLTQDQLIQDKQTKIRLLDIGDDEKRTCLHLAAGEGEKTV